MTKIFFRYTKAEGIQHQQTHTTRNNNGSPSKRRKMITDGNVDLSKERKSTRDGNYIGKNIRFLKVFKYC